MAYDPRTGITTYGQGDIAADPNVAIASESAAADVPSTETAFSPLNVAGLTDARAWAESLFAPAQLDDRGREFYNPGAVTNLQQVIFGHGANVGSRLPHEEFVHSALGAIGGAAGLPQDLDWEPYLLQSAYGIQHGPRTGGAVGGFDIGRENSAALIKGALEAAAREHAALEPYLSLAQPGGELWDIGEDLRANYWDFNRERASRNRHNFALNVLTAFAAPTIGPWVSEAVGGGMLGTAAAGAANAALRATAGGVNDFEDVLRSAAVGGLTAGLTPLAQDAFSGVLDSFGPGVEFADLPSAEGIRPSGAMFGNAPGFAQNNFFGADPGFFSDVGGMGINPAVSSELGGVLGSGVNPALDTEAIGGGALGAGLQVSSLPTTLDMLSAPLRLATDFSLAQAPSTEGMLGSGLDPTISAEAMGAGALGTGVTPQTEAASPARLDAMSADNDYLNQLARAGKSLSQLFGGQGSPEGAPTQQEGQSDEEYAQGLAEWVQTYVPNVDARTMAQMGLTPGTPQYYEYLLGQMDSVLNDMLGLIDFNAADLSSQFRAKTREELDTLRRVLYARGQLEQLMGSGRYLDPFGGQMEDVIANGQRVRPGEAAYHRGLARTVDELARLAPEDRLSAVGGFLDRDVDPYGMQAEQDARIQQMIENQQIVEEWKRRNRGMFGGGFDFFGGGLGQPAMSELDALFAGLL